jgi:protein-tyrosine phosphatase
LRARQINAEDFARFDFILAMDGDNLNALNAMRPKQSRAQVGLFLEYAPELGLLEMPDPYYRDADAFELVLDLATAASRGLLIALEKGA